MEKTKLRDEFVSEDDRKYKFRIGTGGKATALSGFVAGMICASIVWFAVAFFMNLFK